MFNDRHVAAGRVLPKDLARLRARILERESESFAVEAIRIETSIRISR